MYLGCRAKAGTLASAIAFSIFYWRPWIWFLSLSLESFLSHPFDSFLTFSSLSTPLLPAHPTHAISRQISISSKRQHTALLSHISSSNPTPDFPSSIPPAAIMFRRRWDGLPKDPIFSSNLKDLGYFINDQDEIRNIKEPNYYFKYYLTKN
ncbi:hypothetical protein BDP55DRAFT_569671, partial [Colletotrichum godetiae]